MACFTRSIHDRATEAWNEAHRIQAIYHDCSRSFAFDEGEMMMMMLRGEIRSI